MPPGILYERVVAPQVHCHRLAVRRVRNHFRRNTAIAYLRQHALNPFAVIIKLFRLTRSRLEKGVVSLRGEDPLRRKTRHLKLRVHIGRQHEIILLPHDLQQLFVQRQRTCSIPCEPYMFCPVCPPLFLRLKRVEPGGIEVGEPVAGNPLAELAPEILSRVVQSGSGSQSCSGSDKHVVRLPDEPPQLLHALREGRDRWRNLCREIH